MEKARVGRLTRYQHVLLRLGELIAYAECAGSLARRAALLAEGKLQRKGQPALRRGGAGGDQPGLRARSRAQGGARKACAGSSARRTALARRRLAAFEAAAGICRRFIARRPG